MAYRPELAAALSGNSIRQLAYWRQAQEDRAPILVPETSPSRPILYSFRDLMALRTVAFLREQQSLQRIRNALQNLRGLGEGEHLSTYQLVSIGDSIVLRQADEAVDLLNNPGQHLIATLVDVLKPFTNKAGRDVPDLQHPRPLLEVNTAILGGYPVISGTRIPYDDVAALLADGVAASAVKDYYPSVTANGARDAAVFSEYVQSVA